MARKQKVLLIGLGRFGQAHLRTWRQLGLDVLASDLDPAALERARPQALRAAADWRELLDAADLVDIVTPAGTHAEIAIACLEAGKDVFCEKPLALASEDAYAVAEAADAAGRLLQVGHIFRFEPCVEAVRRALREGRIGRVRYVLGRFMGFKRPRADGGVAISDAIHLVDLVSFLLERQPRRVTAVARDYFRRGMDDVVSIALDYGYEMAHVEAGYFPPERRRDLEIMGERGAIVCDFLAPREKVRVYGHAHVRDAEGGWVPVEGETAAIDVAGEEPLRRELEHFLRCVETREAPLCDGFAGAHAVAAIEAALRSARLGRSIALDIRIPAYAS